MLHKQISHEAPIKAPPAEIYAALTDPKLLAKWWIPDTRGESKVGGILEFWLGEFCQRMEVVALEPSRRVRWRAPDLGSADWAQTEIEFDIRPDDEKCWVRFRHDGLRPDVEKLPYYSMSWAVFLLSLKELVEAGEGFPWSRPQVERKRVMNTNASGEVGGVIAAFAAQVGDRRRPLALIGRFRVRAGAGPRIEKAWAEASVQTAREAGVLAYQLHREPENPDAFVVYERWRSLEDLEAHLRTTYIAALRAEIDAVMEGQPTFQVMLPT